MKPNFHLDLQMPPTTTPTTGINLPPQVVWMSRIVAIIHAHFAASETQFALALPQMLAGDFKKLGNMVRVFCEREDPLYLLKNSLSEHDWSKSAVRASAVTAVPEKHPFGWVSYHRVRAPKRGKMQPEAFFERLNHLKTVPSFSLRSLSSGQKFFLAIEEKRHGSGSFKANPNGYGLSHGNEVIALPNLPILKDLKS